MTLKWMLALLAILGGFFTAGIMGGLAVGLFGLWDIPAAGFCAAFAVVVITFLAAPSHKMLSSTLALALGAIVAWRLLLNSYYPENYVAKAYQPTHMPLIATVIGGVLGLALAAILGSVRARIKR